MVPHPEAGQHGYTFEAKAGETLKQFDYVLSQDKKKDEYKNGDIFSIGMCPGQTCVAERVCCDLPLLWSSAGQHDNRACCNCLAGIHC